MEKNLKKILTIFLRVVLLISLLTSTGCGTWENYQANRLIEKGDTLLSEGNIDASLASYTEALELQPENIIALNKRGQIFEERGDIDEALADYEQISEIDPNYREIRNRIGWINVSVQNYEAAREAFNTVLSIDEPLDTKSSLDPLPMAYNGLGTILQKNDNDDEGALSYYARAVEADPNYAAAYYNIGIVSYNQQDTETAREALEKVLSIDPKLDTNSHGEHSQYLEIAYTYLGFIYHDKGEYEKALDNYAKALEIDPDSSDIHIKMGIIYYEIEKDFDAALDSFEQALSVDPKREGAHFYRGLIYEEQENYEKALKAYNQVLLINSEHVNAYFRRGNVHYSRGELENAKEDYDNGLDLEPENINLRKKRADLFYETDQFELALADYEKISEIEPNYREIYNNIGWTNVLILNYEAAREAFNTVLSIDEPLDTKSDSDPLAMAYNGLGAVLEYNDNDDEGALSYYARAVEADPNYAAAYQNIGIVSYNQQAPDAAREAFEKLLSIDPELDTNSLQEHSNYLERAYTYLGLIYHDKKEYKKALDNYAKALDINPDSSDLHTKMGIIYYEIEQDFDAALDSFDKALSVDSKSEGAYFYRGLIYEKKENYEEALEAYNQVLLINPEHVNAYFRRGNLHNSLGMFKKAIDDYDRAIELEPEYLDQVYFHRARAHRKIGDLQAAIEDNSASIKLNPQGVGAHYNRGLSHLDLGNYEEAIEDFNIYIKQNEDNAYAYYYRGLAYQSIGSGKEIEYSQNSDLENAFTDYRKALELDENFSLPLYHLGVMAEEEIGNEDLALYGYQQFLSLHKSDDEYKEQVVARVNKIRGVSDSSDSEVSSSGWLGPLLLLGAAIVLGSALGGSGGPDNDSYDPSYIPKYYNEATGGYENYQCGTCNPTPELVGP